MKVYASRGTLRTVLSFTSNKLIVIDVPHMSTILQSKHDSLARFVHLARALGEVYSLPQTSLHIFYDISGELIAFNRNASLFLNLRFYEAWRESVYPFSVVHINAGVDDADVREGSTEKALISW